MIAASLAAVSERIAAACRAAGRSPASVRLIAVSKAVSGDRLREALAAGLREFGESYVQEAAPKISALRDTAAVWHFIGPVQSNKTAQIGELFDWVHGIDRLKIAERLSAQRPPRLAALNTCVQVNISGEASKSGCSPPDALALCQAIVRLPRLRLRGLMAIPAPASDARSAFRELRLLFETLRAQGLELDTLSAGMSDDLEAAIAEGSTLVRVGGALFGPRSRPSSEFVS